MNEEQTTAPAEAAPAPAPEISPPVKKVRKPRKPKAPVQAAPEPEPAPEPAPAPKRTRKPKAAVTEEDGEEDDNKPFKMPKHYVEHSGSVITLMGTDVKLRVMTPAKRAAHGIKEIIGTMGKPCEGPVLIKFKNRAAALKFFDLCLHADDEKNEYIDCGSKTDWFGEELMRSFQ